MLFTFRNRRGVAAPDRDRRSCIPHSQHAIVEDPLIANVMNAHSLHHSVVLNTRYCRRGRSDGVASRLQASKTCTFDLTDHSSSGSFTRHVEIQPLGNILKSGPTEQMAAAEAGRAFKIKSWEWQAMRTRTEDFARAERAHGPRD